MTDPAHTDAARRGGVRDAHMRTPGVTIEHLRGGAMLIKSKEELRPYPKVLTDRLDAGGLQRGQAKSGTLPARIGTIRHES